MLNEAPSGFAGDPGARKWIGLMNAPEAPSGQLEPQLTNTMAVGSRTSPK